MFGVCQKRDHTCDLQVDPAEVEASLAFRRDRDIIVPGMQRIFDHLRYEVKMTALWCAVTIGVLFTFYSIRKLRPVA